MPKHEQRRAAAAPACTSARFAKNSSTASKNDRNDSPTAAARHGASLQQPRQPAVLQHPAAGLLLRAVAHHVVLEVDRLDRRAAARARLARAAVHLRAASAACRAPSRRSPPRSGRARRRSRRRRSPRRSRSTSSASSSEPFWNGDSRAVQRISSTHERPMPGDRALVAQQRVEVAGLVEQLGELLERRRRPAPRGRAWPPPRPRSTSPAGSSLAHARCWVPNSRRRSSRPSSRRTSSREARSRSEARSSQSWSRPADIRWISSASSPSSTTNILPRRRTPLDRRARERVERRVEGLHRDHARAPAPTPRARRPAARVQAAGGDLDLGQLGHRR